MKPKKGDIYQLHGTGGGHWTWDGDGMLVVFTHADQIGDFHFRFLLSRPIQQSLHWEGRFQVSPDSARDHLTYVGHLEVDSAEDK